MEPLGQTVKGTLCQLVSREAQGGFGDAEGKKSVLIQNGLGLKTQMTASEALKALEALEDMSDELYLALAKAAGVCGNQKCCMEVEEAVSIRLPRFILEEAGISRDAKLCAYTEEGSGEVTVIAAEYAHDLSEVSQSTLQTVKRMGICLAGLNECLMSEHIVYGEREEAKCEDAREEADAR